MVATEKCLSSFLQFLSILLQRPNTKKRQSVKLQNSSKLSEICKMFFFNLISLKHAVKLNNGDAFVGAVPELFKGIWRQRLWPCVWPWLLVCLSWFLAIAALRISWLAVSLQLALITCHFGPLQSSLLLPPITFTLYCLEIINGKTTEGQRTKLRSKQVRMRTQQKVLCFVEDSCGVGVSHNYTMTLLN